MWISSCYQQTKYRISITPNRFFTNPARVSWAFEPHQSHQLFQPLRKTGRASTLRRGPSFSRFRYSNWGHKQQKVIITWLPGSSRPETLRVEGGKDEAGISWNLPWKGASPRVDFGEPHQTNPGRGINIATSNIIKSLSNLTFFSYLHPGASGNSNAPDCCWFQSRAKQKHERWQRVSPCQRSGRALSSSTR